MRIEAITTVAQFDALQDHWRELEAACPTTSIFLTWEWQRLWWRHYGQARQLCILAAWDGGKLLGLLPLYIEKRRLRGVLPVRKLRQIGAGGDTAPDDLDPLLHAARMEPVATALADHVIQHLAGWGVLDFNDLQPDAPFTTALIDASRRNAAWLRVGEPSRITYGSLPATWNAFLAGLTSNRREVVRRKRRKFEQLDGARCISCWNEGAPLDAAFDRLAELHRLRWTGRTDHPSFTTPEYLGFHRDLMHALLARGRLRLLELELGGRSVAMLYGYRLGGSFYYFQSGFDPAVAPLSPGELLLGYAIESAILEGCTTFDMLKGDYDHKRHFFQQTRGTVGVKAYRPGITAWAYRCKEWLDARTKPSHGARQPESRQTADVEAG